MSLWKREHSPARSAASRTNGARSRRPQTPQGKAIALRNPLKGTGESEVMESSLAALGESREESEKKHQALAEAMQPRDAWEAAWVRDIAAPRCAGDSSGCKGRKRESWLCSGAALTTGASARPSRPPGRAPSV